MAWTLVDSTQFDQGGTVLQNFAITLPSFSEGDLCIIGIVKDQDLGTWSTSANGWSLHSSDKSSSGRDRSTAVFYKVMGSSETSPMITYSDATKEEVSWTAHVFRSPTTLSQLTVVAESGFQNPGNVQNPTPSDVTSTVPNSCVVALQFQTHDDCTGAGSPTGFSLGETIIGGTKDNRQQIIAYNLDIGSVGSKSFTPFTSTWNSAVSETVLYTLLLQGSIGNGPNLIATSSPIWYELDPITLTGVNLGSSQGNGKLELSNVSTYGDIDLVDQMINGWSNTDIEITPTVSGLDTSNLYAYVTDDSGNVSAAYPVQYGIESYHEIVKNTGPDIYHRFNNTYDDVMGHRSAANVQSGSVGFESIPLTRSNGHAWTFYSNNARTEVADSPFTNTSEHHARNIGGWIQLDRIHLVPSGIYEEGGGVNNLYMVVGFGNILLGNIADSNGSPDYKVQAFSDYNLSTDRPYHVMIRFQDGYTGMDGKFTMYVDGVEVNQTDGNPITDTAGMSGHSGDWSYGKPDGNLDTGGTDIAYPGATGTLISDFATWSYGNGAPLSEDQIRIELFEKGAIADTTLSGTQSQMQSQLDTLKDTTYVDLPLAIKVLPRDDGGDTTLIFDDIEFDSRCSIQIQFVGKSSSLTMVNKGRSNITLSKCSNPWLGNIILKHSVNVKVHVVDFSGDPIGSARVYLRSTGGDLPEHTTLINGLTDVNGEIEHSLLYSSDQPINGWVRKSPTGSVQYKHTEFSGLVTSDGVTISVQMDRD